MAERPVVFISYSHDSNEHRQAVRELAERLKIEKFEVLLDQWAVDRLDTSWPRWMEASLGRSDFALLVCTEKYSRCFSGLENGRECKGVDWEGQIITNDLYKRGGRSRKYIPVFLGAADERWIPKPLENRQHYTLSSDKGIRSLCRVMLGADDSDPESAGAADDSKESNGAEDEAKERFKERRRAATAQICAKLEDDRAAFLALVDRCGRWIEAPERDWQVLELVEALWALPLTKLLELMNETHRKLVGGDAALCERLKPIQPAELVAASETIESILRRMVPQRVVDEVTWKADDSHGGLILRIRAAKRPWAEMTAAGYYDREWLFEPSGEELVSRAEVTPPLRLFNRIDCHGGMEMLAVLVKHLCGLPFSDKPTLRRPSFLQADDRRYFFDGKKDSEIDFLEICRYLNSELELEAAEVGFFHYLMLPSTFEADRREFIELIKEHLSHLHLLVLDSSPDPGETVDRFSEARSVSLIYRLLTRRRPESDS